MGGAGAKGLYILDGGTGLFRASLKQNDIDEKRDALVLEKLIKDIEYYKTLGLTKTDLLKLIEQHYDN